jgi:Icc-related predicted phosphoesterase
MVQEETKTNGWVIKLVGKRMRLADSYLHAIEWGLYSTVLLPYFCFKVVQGTLARPEQTFRQYIFQIFGWCGSLPTLPAGVSAGGSAKCDSEALRFVCISDTHNQHESIQVPDGDVIVHCGDFSNHGSLEETARFARWFSSLPHRHKILVPGNHDMIMDRGYYKAYWNDWSHVKQSTDEAFALFEDKGVHVLVDESVTLGGVKVYGCPQVVCYASWQTAFNSPPDKISPYWKNIPDDVDVLLTHSPPAGILDREPFGESAGCPLLLEAMQKRLKPAYHVFGHIHSDWGAKRVGDTCFVNAASVTDFYSTAGRTPLCFDVAKAAAGAVQASAGGAAAGDAIVRDGAR